MVYHAKEEMSIEHEVMGFYGVVLLSMACGRGVDTFCRLGHRCAGS